MMGTIDYGIESRDNQLLYRKVAERIGTCISEQRPDECHAIPAVHILKTGRVIVGRRARSALQTDPDNVSVEFEAMDGAEGQEELSCCSTSAVRRRALGQRCSSH